MEEIKRVMEDDGLSSEEEEEDQSQELQDLVPSDISPVNAAQNAQMASFSQKIVMAQGLQSMLTQQTGNMSHSSSTS